MTEFASAGLDMGTVVSRTRMLETFWRRRNLKMKDWYEQIQMVDTLAQRDMESFVGNDPRASLNLIRGILNQRIPHRIPAEAIGVEEAQPAAELSRMFDLIWEDIFLSYRQRGKDWKRDLINFLLATGWYAVYAAMAVDGSNAVAEVLNPATVYPRWDNILTECAHVFMPGGSAIKGMCERNGWEAPLITDTTEIRDYWWIEFMGSVPVIHNAIVCGEKLVKSDTIEAHLKRIPIFTAPVGGLPDTGELAKNRRLDYWKGEIGQSFIATNENVYRASNKWWTFMLQILRDTAQPRTYEKTNSAKQIVNPATWNMRGAHYKLGQQDEIGFITPPPIPVELRSTQLDLEAMMQRGGPSWTMFGSIQQRMTAYAMAQVAATTNQIAGDFHQGVIDCISDIDNFFFALIKDNSYTPLGMSIPAGLPPGVRISADYELRIPGDIIQRATTGRMLNPEFELSDERIMEELFPEIKNPVEELARIRASKARKHPIYVQLNLVSTLREEAALLLSAKDAEGATLYSMAADRLEQEIRGPQQQAAPPPPAQGAPPTQREPVEPRNPREPNIPGERR